MTDEDDEALTWAGDDEVAPAAAPRAATAVAEDDRDEVPGGRLGPVIAMLGVAALVESALWVQGVFFGGLAATLGSPDAGGVAALTWVLNVVERVAGVAAPLVWFGVTLAVVGDQRRRVAVLLLGVVLLLPWPALVRLL